MSRMPDNHASSETVQKTKWDCPKLSTYGFAQCLGWVFVLFFKQAAYYAASVMRMPFHRFRDASIEARLNGRPRRQADVQRRPSTMKQTISICPPTSSLGSQCTHPRCEAPMKDEMALLMALLKWTAENARGAKRAASLLHTCETDFIEFAADHRRHEERDLLLQSRVRRRSDLGQVDADLVPSALPLGVTAGREGVVPGQPGGVPHDGHATNGGDLRGSSGRRLKLRARRYFSRYIQFHCISKFTSISSYNVLDACQVGTPTLVRQVGKFWALNATALTCESLYRTKSRGKSPPKYRDVASEPKLVGTESSHPPIPLVAVG
ncbi:hypothetical protein CCM_08383 [Cordyceps militaris CM01]|uniref:Uncharacterized protein n=1 Tax=Cordyceps militaris (strain CM01) TaxID=983644 RepID=G3JR44_CORMM|nr:uncharacterized protein CCM_08383 [Cordyceps militaris CM01]EGX88340.1 hypothetical protein CCM_08383 [Cordyceps militaris CM01]